VLGWKKQIYSELWWEAISMASSSMTEKIMGRIRKWQAVKV
jgi:hypothetical protein